MSLLRGYKLLLLTGVAAIAALALPGTGHAQVDAMGSGAGWFDCDNDGNLDLVYLTPQGAVFLLVYDPISEVFVDITETAIPEGFRTAGDSGLGIVCGDINNDGYSDLFLTKNGPNHLLLNNGDDTFRGVSRAAGVVGRDDDGEVLSASAAFLDYDNDGLLDVYVVNYEGNANQLFHNTGVDGDGIPHFEDVAEALGVDRPALGQSNWGLGIAVSDYDNDGDADIYVANDYDGNHPITNELNPGPNILYRNNGNGTFTDVTYDAGVGDDGWAMGVAFGDYNGDGWQDIYLANFWEDVLYENNGDGTFTDVTRDVGIIREDDPTQWHYNGWGTSFMDIDNDGDLDIHVANGYITNGEGQVFNEPNELWENMGPNFDDVVQFEEVGEAADVDDIGDGRGAAYADFNKDGFIDFAVINNNYVSGPGIEEAPLRLLYINQQNGVFRDRGQSYQIRVEFADALEIPGRGDYSGNHWIQIQPVGTVSNRSGIGCRVTARAGEQVWIREIGAGSYCSSNPNMAHIGLGDVTVLDEVSIDFPSGINVTKSNVSADQFLTVSEDEETPVRLLSFGATRETGGALVEWRFDDDGDLTTFALSREVGGVTEELASSIIPKRGYASYLDRTAPAGKELTYSLDALYRDGTRERVGSTSFRFEVRAGQILRQNYPNPFAAATVIPIERAPGGSVEVQVFDGAGRLVRTLRGAVNESGGFLRWDGTNNAGRSVPAGTYFYRLGKSGETLKMIRRP